MFGRHGGLNDFDIEYVHSIVAKIAKTKRNIYFLFLNTARFCEPLPNIIHLEQTADLDRKVEFINTCDAMLWACKAGETFSCSMGEFAIRNKPIFCTPIGILGHVHILDSNALWYSQDTLKELLLGFNRKEASKKDWNTYKQYTPENVMKIFKQVFLD